MLLAESAKRSSHARQSRATIDKVIEEKTACMSCFSYSLLATDLSFTAEDTTSPKLKVRETTVATTESSHRQSDSTTVGNGTSLFVLCVWCVG